MTVRAYQRQHLAIVAAGNINGAGTTSIGIGCGMTRIGTGQYGLVLPDDYGIQDNRTFSMASVKGTSAAARSAVVEDTSDTLKTIRVFNNSANAADNDIEVMLFRSVESGS